MKRQNIDMVTKLGEDCFPGSVGGAALIGLNKYLKILAIQ